MLFVVTDSRRSYHGMVDRLEQQGGARVLTLDPTGGVGIASKTRILRQLVSPRLLGLRRRWRDEDVVLVIGWYLLPLLALIHLKIVGRPSRLVSIATFVHSPAVRRVVNAFLRVLAVRELEFVAFSEEELRNLSRDVRIPLERIHKVIYRSRLAPELEPDPAAAPYVFTGGYSNRDYETLFAAVDGLAYHVVAVVSTLNRVSDPPANVELHVDLPWDEFEQKLASCSLLVLPLRAAGEASGQNVLMRGMRYLRPTLATRHSALVDYLGEGYSGFVTAEEPRELRNSITRGMEDESFRAELVDQLSMRRQALLDRGEMADEILEILT
jgi:glycosyltransferase involved in cell wall biosynthesis